MGRPGPQNIRIHAEVVMRTWMKCCAVALACCFAVTAAMAGGDEKCTKAAGDKAACDAAAKAVCSADLSACKDMPRIVAMVGDKKFECPISAEECAKKDGKKVAYTLGDKKFDNRDKAMGAYADALDAYVVRMVKVTSAEDCCADGCAGKSAACCAAGESSAKAGATCSQDGQKKQTGVTGATVAAKATKTDRTDKTAKATKTDKAAKKAMWCVAGRCYDCPDKAAAAAKLVSAAVSEVKMAYRVGDEKFCCDKMAGEKAKKVGKPVTFVVGEQTSESSIMARIQLDMAKIAAAQKVLEKNTETKKSDA